MIKTIRCTCKSEFQDKRYGKNKRLANETTKGPGGTRGWRCTVCGKDSV